MIGQQTFDSLDDLIEHYKKHPIFRHDRERLFLVRPFVHPSEASDFEPRLGGQGDATGGYGHKDLPNTPESTLS